MADKNSQRYGCAKYSIRPSERKKGYATLMLSLGLERCRELSLNKVLITCDKSNIASAKVIQNNKWDFGERSL